MTHERNDDRRSGTTTAVTSRLLTFSARPRGLAHTHSRCSAQTSLAPGVFVCWSAWIPVPCTMPIADHS